MKMPKIRSYIRLVAGFVVLSAIFFIAQFLVLHFNFSRNILKQHFRENRDMVLHIKAEILREAGRDPQFALDDFIKRHNTRYTRLKLVFVPADQIRPGKGRLYKSKTQWNHRRPEFLGAVPLRYKGINGYLILYSKRFQSLSTFLDRLTVFMLITLLPSLIIGFFIFRKIYHKSSVLVEAVEKVSQGDYSVRVNLAGNDEYSRIGQAFNNMTASIEKSTRELKEMDIQRRQFIADISHELATPLTSLKGYVETLRMEELKLTEGEQRQYLKIVWDETERLSLLVKDLLELARMDAGTIKLELDLIDCREFMNSFAGRNELQLKQRNVDLEWRVEPGQFVYADYRRLEQIMQNLLVNALKHSGGLARIIVKFSEITGQTVINFSDNGAGILPEHLDRIFNRFYKVNGEFIHSAAKNSGGDTGLGLSIVKGLVELHGGKIEVESITGKGTTFTMIFPIKNHDIPAANKGAI